jgi:hypothetical protein
MPISYKQEWHHAELERRLHPRYSGERLIARLDDKLVDVADISLTGLKAKANIIVGADLVDMTIYPRDGGRLDLNAGVRTRCVPMWAGGGFTGLRFHRSTMALSRLIIRLMSDQLGVEPYYVK